MPPEDSHGMARLMRAPTARFEASMDTNREVVKIYHKLYAMNELSSRPKVPKTAGNTIEGTKVHRPRYAETSKSQSFKSMEIVVIKPDRGVKHQYMKRIDR